MRRLHLIPTTLAHLDDELSGGATLGRMLEAAVPASWPPGEYDRDAMAFFRERLLEGGEAAVGWYGWYAIDRDGDRDGDGDGGGDAARLVGAGGYFGPPVDGRVEIGYSIAPEFRRRGYATELVGALVARAFSLDGIDTVVAHTTHANPASIGVLVKSGFAEAGPDGDAVLFVRTRSSSRSTVVRPRSES
jgi:ribosomal-protein-alanine N-acetyltransferase